MIFTILDRRNYSAFCIDYVLLPIRKHNYLLVSHADMRLDENLLILFRFIIKFYKIKTTAGVTFKS